MVFLRPLPIDCKFLILDLEGLANTTLSIFLILIPVEKVPYEACHGAEGQGMAVFPALAGQSSDYITQRLYAYKNRETVGAMSSTMWAQAGMLSDADINMIGKFIEVELK